MCEPSTSRWVDDVIFILYNVLHLRSLFHFLYFYYCVFARSIFFDDDDVLFESYVQSMRCDLADGKGEGYSRSVPALFYKHGARTTQQCGVVLLMMQVIIRASICE